MTKNTDSPDDCHPSRQAKRADRKSVLLRAAYDLLTKADRAHFVEQSTHIVTFYDGANCDGYCLRDDIADELGIDDQTDPIPLDPDDL